METVMIVMGALCFLFGASAGIWAVRSSDPTAVAFRYQGAMFMALGGTFILSNVFSPNGLLYAVLGALGVVVFWSGWQHVRILRQLALDRRSNLNEGTSH
jgi:drug/metabolite transporter (DMT)-like permease